VGPAPAKRRSALVPWLAAAVCLLAAGAPVWWALRRETGDGKVATSRRRRPTSSADLLALKDVEDHLDCA
jgi:hypothetical protein